ncbi:MAG: metal ABC transporter ATP-binding protein [Theionarchaea archaeon]|nr:metal ABC transporter ATP-binding protein [Theionarchaea archaeon]
MIELKNVSAIYEGEKIPSIKNINLTVARGEFVTIVGPNGAGKTTLLETINGLLESEGKISVLGMDLRKNGSQIRKRIGYVPQEFTCNSLTPFLVKDVILMGRFGKIGLLKSPSATDYQVVHHTMEFLSVVSLQNNPVGKLSGGQLQKVMIARALAKEPDILLLDEPFSNLDLKARSDISLKISSLHARGLTVIMVIHDRSSIPETCRRIITIENGEITSDKKLEVT